MSVLRDIGNAVRLLTVLPFGGAEGARPVAYFTWLGWLFTGVGAGIASAAFALEMTHGIPSLLVAALIVAAWGALSGFLHWDGLADSADGLGVRGDAARRLAVMRDSTVGGFGVVAVVFIALLQVTALAVVIDSGTWWALGAPVIGRFGAALALWFRRPASDVGLAARYAGKGSLPGALLLLVPVLPLALVPFPPVAGRLVATVAGMTFAALAPSLFTRRLGGINGDVLGAVILLAETFTILLAALAGGLV